MRQFRGRRRQHNPRWCRCRRQWVSIFALGLFFTTLSLILLSAKMHTEEDKFEQDYYKVTYPTYRPSFVPGEEPKGLLIGRTIGMLDSSDQVHPKSVHIFYYGWYGNPKWDKKWVHWDHEVLPHWVRMKNAEYPNVGSHYDPNQGQLGSTYYPKLGPYSSRNLEVVTKHFRDIKELGVDACVVSWHGPWGAEFGKDSQTQVTFPHIMSAAETTGMKVILHLEPYPHGANFTLNSRVNDIQHIMRVYGDSPALYRDENGSPWYYIYDSYRTKPDDWKSFFRKVRGTVLDGVFIGLYVDADKAEHLKLFDGFYTYFASDKTSLHSNPKNWQKLQQKARASGQIFIPSVGPGYNDLRVRPWNKGVTVARHRGEYYENMWRKAAGALGDRGTISITSFNEWHEGTQIEASIEKQGYETEDIDYMEKTKQLIMSWRNREF